MNISRTILSTLQYIFEGVARIFSVTDDEYPLVGIQPFAGEPFKPGEGWD